ncbi:MAG: FAD-binding oxidoreductase, partial [Candidatus Limnocylindria bacterium]
MPSLAAALDIPQLRADLTGRVITPDDAEYDEARVVVMGGIDRRPGVIVRVANTAVVSRVVALARETGLELAVRSGGHSGAGHSATDGGIVLDVRDMKGLDIDVDGRTAWAETGLTAADVTAALASHG